MAAANVVSLNGEAAADLDEPDWKHLFRLRPPPEQFKKTAFGRSKVQPEDNRMGPEWAAVAHRHWLKITSEMRQRGLLATVNDHMIFRLVICRIRHDFALDKLVQQGSVTFSSRTKVPKNNLWLNEARSASSDATTLEAELGLSPRRRKSAAKATTTLNKGVAADSYLAAATARK